MPPDIFGIDCLRLQRDSFASNQTAYDSRCPAGLTNSASGPSAPRFSEKMALRCEGA